MRLPPLRPLSVGSTKATPVFSIIKFNRQLRQTFLLLLGLMFLAGASIASAAVVTGIVINEIDYDQPSTDTAEFLELYNTTDGPVSLDGMTLEFINGSNDSIYDTIALPNVTLAAGEYFVVCANAATVANCDLDDGPNTNFIQNGAPDAIGLRSMGTLIDAVSYEGSATAPYVEGTGTSAADSNSVENVSISRVPNGTDTDNNDNDFALVCSTPGASNAPDTLNCVPDDPPAVSSTNPADNATGVPVDSTVGITFNEDVTVSNDAFSIDCTSSGSVSFSVSGGPVTFILTPTGDFVLGEVCTVVITATGVSDMDGTPDDMAEDFSFSFTVADEVIVLPDVVINEVDADQSGTDSMEIIELYDGGAGNTDLTGLVLVAYNGSDNQSYNLGGQSNAIDLDGFSTNADGFFVIGNAATPNVDIVISNSSLQNGADAVALYLGNGTDFPNDTPISLSNLVDAMVYDTDDSDDAGLLVLLNAGQPQVNERGGGDGLRDSNQRCPNGSGGARNTDTYLQAPPTPGAANDCSAPFINEVDADTPGSDTLEFIELYDGGVGNLPLDGFVVVLYNGSDGKSYTPAFDLDGFSTDADGYFVIGNAGVANVDLVIPGNTIQNGADAVTVFIGDGDDFPNDTPLTTVNLIDAIVYDTNDADDPDVLPLLNPGQPQVNEGGNGDKDNHSNQRCPNGFGGARNTDTYTQATATPGAENGCPPLEIWQIQGAGTASPFAGFSVTTIANSVTAVGTNGFFMQTPTARTDSDIDTSDGIWVFTGGAPGVSVGDVVDVSGPVSEFFDLTEFTLPAIAVTGTGPVPAAVVLDGSTPTLNPAAPSCAIEYECYEGMLVTVPEGQVTGGSQFFGSDPIAEAHIVAGPARPFREPGVIFPGLGGTIPTWDGNPEVFELDPNKLGLPSVALAAGSTFSVTGGLGYEFGGYEIWASSLSNVVSVDPVVPVRGTVTGEMTVGSLNMFRLFASESDYLNRLAKFSNYIRNVMGSPDILGVQEVNSITELTAIANAINSDDPGVSYTPFLVEGNDFGGIDVGFLIGSDVATDAITQLGADELHTFDNSLLHDRPPLLFEGHYTGNGLPFPLAVLVVHNRSLNNIDDPADGARVRNKRLEQAESIAAMAQNYQSAHPDVPFVIVGDFNAFEFTDGYVDVIGHIKGDFDPAESLLSGSDLVDPNLTNQLDNLSAGDPYSFVFRGTAQVLDHALTSTTADIYARGMQYGRGNADAVVGNIADIGTVNRSSDHDGLVLYLMTDFDGDGFADDEDLCPFGAGDAADQFNNFSLLDGCIVPIPATDYRGLMLLALLLLTLGATTLRRTVS